MATSATLQPRRSTLWQSLAEAVRGTQQDFTEGSISRAIFLLATPMVLEMSMESLFAVVDVFWVTRLGASQTLAWQTGVSDRASRCKGRPPNAWQSARFGPMLRGHADPLTNAGAAMCKRSGRSA